MKRLAVALLTLLAMAACGDSAAGIGQRASSRLAPQVEQVKAAAVSGDRATAAAKLAQLRASVSDLRQRNELSAPGAAKVLAAAAEVEAQLGTAASTQAPQVSTTAPTPSVTSATTPPRAPGNSDDGGGGGDGGKRKGKGGN